MPFVEDLTVFLADFGQDATLAGASVRVIFEAAGTAQLGLGVLDPAVQLPTASVPSAYRDAELVIPGAGTYLVRDHVPDGTGWSTLVLTKVS